MENFQPYDAATYEALRQQAAKNERKAIRRLGLFAGSAILLYILIQNVTVLLMQVFGVYTAYLNTPLLQAGVDILIVLLSLLPAFAISAKPMRTISGVQRSLPLDRPKDVGQMLLAVPAGLGFCMLANQVTSYIVVLISAFGFELSSPDLPMPSGVLGVTVSFFRVVVVAAVCEELCFRGFVMQHLRRFGDWFAITMAAFVFALMHGNLIQAPFALIVGMALGYLTIKTGTLWTAILIHALNNAISLLTSYLLERVDADLLNAVYLYAMAAIMVVGLICFLIFVLRQRRLDVEKKAVRTVNGFWAKTGAYLTSPTMLVAIGLMFYFTLHFVKRVRG